jgi:RNA polymerase sigma-70 factor, ECF subfamily
MTKTIRLIIDDLILEDEMEKNQQISQWFDLYSDDIYHFLYYRMGTQDVDDLVQEVYIRAIKSYDSFQGNSSPKTWLYSIARHLAIDEIRKKQRNKWKDILSFDSAHEPRTECTPEHIIGLSEENLELVQAIHTLSSNYREILILRGVNGLNTTETAAILDWNENKVRSTYHRAKQLLMKKMGGLKNDR